MFMNGWWLGDRSFHQARSLLCFPVTADTRQFHVSSLLLRFPETRRILTCLFQRLQVLHYQRISPRTPERSVRARNPSQVASVWSHHQQAVWVFLLGMHNRIRTSSLSQHHFQLAEYCYQHRGLNGTGENDKKMTTIKRMRVNAPPKIIIPQYLSEGFLALEQLDP
jgi:hypothetical protein